METARLYHAARRRGGSVALALLFLAASLLTLGSASAQTYPSRPITLVVPYPPGGATDAIARTMQDSMAQSLGQQIVIENIGGAGGMIAAGRAARAAPDGYTLLPHQVALATAMTFYPNLAFDAEKDFVTIGLVNTAATTIAARPTFGHHPKIAPASARSAILCGSCSPKRSVPRPIRFPTAVLAPRRML